MPDLDRISAAVGRPIEIDPSALSRREARRRDTIVLRDGPLGFIGVTWISIPEFTNIRWELWARRRIRDLGDEAYRLRRLFGGGLMARRGHVAVDVNVVLPGEPRAEHERVADAVARVCLAQHSRNAQRRLP